MADRSIEYDSDEWWTNTSLRRAVESNDVSEVKELLKTGIDVNAKNDLGTTPLHVAAWHGHQEVAEVLLAYGAAVNVREKKRYSKCWTPLHYAASEGHAAMAALLVAHGADVRSRAANGKTPLDVDREGALSLPEAVKSNDIGYIKALLDGGLDANAKDDDGMTPLHIAVREDYQEVVEALLNKGADVNAKNDDGMTPLHIAVREDCQEVVEILLTKGADANARDELGKTPLYDATSKEVAELLLANSAMVNTRNKWGETPFGLATEQGRHEVAELLSESTWSEERVKEEVNKMWEVSHDEWRDGYINYCDDFLDIHRRIKASFMRKQKRLVHKPVKSKLTPKESEFLICACVNKAGLWRCYNEKGGRQFLLDLIEKCKEAKQQEDNTTYGPREWLIFISVSLPSLAFTGLLAWTLKSLIPELTPGFLTGIIFIGILLVWIILAYKVLSMLFGDLMEECATRYDHNWKSQHYIRAVIWLFFLSIVWICNRIWPFKPFDWQD